jgi:cytochrome c oxidase subunit 1
MFILGYWGMPRRYADYIGEFADLHFASSLGAMLNGVAYILILGNLIYAAFKGRAAGKNPYDSLSLEWSIPSPPPLTNFDEIPTVTTWTYGYGEENNA